MTRIRKQSLCAALLAATAGLIISVSCTMEPARSSSTAGGASGIGGSGPGTGGSGDAAIGTDDPSCLAYSPPVVHTMTPVDPQASSLVSQMSITQKIAVLSGDQTMTPDYTTDAPFRSLGVPSLNITNYPMRDATHSTTLPRSRGRRHAVNRSPRGTATQRENRLTSSHDRQAQRRRFCGIRGPPNRGNLIERSRAREMPDLEWTYRFRAPQGNLSDG